MDTKELLNIRLYNQLLTKHTLTEPQEVVAWMGAIQAQMLDLAKWAIGVRLENKTVKDIDHALNTGQIIRTHILRPTWHFVSSEDIHWMFDLSNPRIKPAYQSYAKTLGADEKLIFRAIHAIEKILEGNKHLTKLELGEALYNQHIYLDNNHLRITINYAEMEGILVNGCIKGSKQTFTLLNELAPRKETLHKEEALERLARRYFMSHGPSTVQDFSWWSGLSLTECKQAIEIIRSDFISEKVNNRDFIMRNDIKVPSGTNPFLLLPPFDEFVVSYKDRSELILKDHYSKVMTKNGIFSPTIMYNGEIVGSWKKNKLKNTMEVGFSFFEIDNQIDKDRYNIEIDRLKQFYL